MGTHIHVCAHIHTHISLSIYIYICYFSFLLSIYIHTLTYSIVAADYTGVYMYVSHTCQQLNARSATVFGACVKCE